MAPLINTISRTLATKRVQNWLQYATKKFGLKAAAAPKAILIPRADIEDALYEFERFDKLKRKASGVRIYFTKNFPMTDVNDDLRITCIVVPTVISRKRNKQTGLPIHNDAIIKIPANNRAGATRAVAAKTRDGGVTETIYDFSSPCPTDCDGTTDWN